MAKRTLKRSNIGYLGMGADGRPIDKVFAWNPGGEGCSNGCDGCWARAIAKRNVHCEDCRAFRVHLHEERLCEPANTKTPRLVLVNFTCDTFDRKRPAWQVGQSEELAAAAPWHTYVWLTQQTHHLRGHTTYATFGAGARRVGGERNYFAENPNWYLGLTIRNQQEADERLPDFFSIPGKKWISYEPAVGGFDLLAHDPKGLCGEAQQYAWENLQGIIIGHDRRKGAPGTDTLSHIRSCVEQCKAAGVNFWTKQVWQSVCLECGDRFEGCHEFCPFCKRPVRSKLLHASKPDEYTLFPDDLKGGRLPWSAPKEQR